VFIIIGQRIGSSHNVKALRNIISFQFF